MYLILVLLIGSEILILIPIIDSASAAAPIFFILYSSIFIR